ncbi:glycoside hydrolase family 3 protein [Terfezia boudieri ATCC MYA-4762]|uniref:beta-glucosidase n=1 Tax=Terfezia boudieri ATCC MYA-4762 TaxID=1051890 RepID=A0A3N4MMX1_9PEZI|nr:glycoside hydrolase family 3 protein [Terfezia boudieri ATCC MYA-4762]
MLTLSCKLTAKGGSILSWAEAYDKAYGLVSQMTLVEKANVTSGLGWAMGLCVGNTGPVDRLGFPSLCLQDGPLGLRFADKATAFPAGITAGMTWNRGLLYQRGAAHGKEARGKGIHVLLGPAFGALGRMPAAGRNWEGFSVDPYLMGIASAETIKGIQSYGVSATAKHFIANEQEHFRQGVNAISSNVDDRTMHEMYLWPFADAVHAGVGAVMCSYNKVNNSAACENSKLMNGLLKDELGFQGFVMSDWLAQMSGVASALSGLDMTMPGDGYLWDDRKPFWGPQLTRSIINGSLPYDRLDDMTTRIVATWYHFGQNKDFPEVNFSSWTKNSTGRIYEGSGNPPYGEVNKHVNVMEDNHLLARQVATEGTVLLKNNDGFLPLKKKAQKIGIYGEDAGPGDGPNACTDRGCNQGTLAVGWGSGSSDFEYLVSPLEAIQRQAAQDGSKISAILNNTLLAEVESDSSKQDVCLVFINSDSGEGYITWDNNAGDRNDLYAQKGGDNLVLAAAKRCRNTVVVVHSVGPIIMEKWINHRNVRSVVWANLPGQESGNALVDILYGDANPSGKLAYTIGRSLEDYGPTAGVMYTANAEVPQQDFTEGLYLDYRHFDKESISPRFEFGYGMSYTKYSYANIRVYQTGRRTPLPARRPHSPVSPPTYNSTIPKPEEALYPPGFQRINRMIYPYLDSENITYSKYPYPEGYDTPATPSQAGGGEGGNPALWEELYKVTVQISNTGHVAGAEVAQLYVSYPSEKKVDFPVRQLRGFEKVWLEPGQKKTLTFYLRRRDLSYWDVVRQNWIIPDSTICVSVGASSRKLYEHASLP